MILFLDPTLEIDSTSGLITPWRIGLQQDHVDDLRLFLQYLLKIYNQIPLETMTPELRIFQSRKPNLKLICEMTIAIIPTSWFYNLFSFAKRN